MNTPFKLYLISAESNFPNEAYTVAEIFTLGLTHYHLRKPGWSHDEMRTLLSQLPAGIIPKIVLHSHFELCNEFELKGIHLNEENRKRISHLNQYKIISCSFHSFQDIRQNEFPYAYIFLSPVFNSISKQGYLSNFDLNSMANELATLKLTTRIKLVALGGISAENIQLIKDAGFDGAALMGSIWQTENPLEAYRTINSLNFG